MCCHVCFYAVLGLEPRTLHASQTLTTELHPNPLVSFLEHGGHFDDSMKELFDDFLGAT